MIAIPNMDKPKRGEVIAFDGENAVYTDDDMNVHRYPLIEIVRCKDCIWSYTDKRDGTLWCKVHMSHYRVNSDHFCKYGERRADGHI